MPSNTQLSHVLLLTGSPGIGKTTVIRKVASEIKRQHCIRLGGFVTEEIRQGEQRLGFRLVTFGNEHATMAHVSFDHPHRVGKYGVDVALIDRFSESTIRISADVDVYIIDEIGKMECMSLQFVTQVQKLLNSNKPVVATVAKHGGGLMESVKHWPASDLWEVTHTNRDGLPNRVMQWLHSRLSTH